MDTASCPFCDADVMLTTVFRYPEGWEMQLQNHGTETALSCAGSLTAVTN